MPRKYLMSWEGAPYFRWVKMYRGVRYRISAADLNAPLNTQEGSYQEANKWWTNKLNELNRPDPRTEILQRYAMQDIEDKERELLALKTLYFANGVRVLLGEDKMKEVFTAKQIVGASNQLEPPKDATLEGWIASFLTDTQRTTKPRSFREIREFMGVLKLRLPTPDKINEQTVTQLFQWVIGQDLADTTKKKRWGFVKRFIGYLDEQKAIDRPRNLQSKLYIIKASPKQVTVRPLNEVRTILEAMEGRVKCWALLGLNCAMTNADIGMLRKDMVNEGYLTRKRVKTAEYEDVPVVRYKLWPETLALLDEFESNHPEWWFTSNRGTPLVSNRIEEGNVKEKDLVAKEWKRRQVGMMLSEVRSISVSLLEDHEVYGRCATLFLGHSPRSIKDRHYSAPPQTLFNNALDWLRTQFLDCKQ